MKKYIAVLEIEDDEEIIDASVSYSYSYNGMNYKATEIVELKEESEDTRNKTYEYGLNEAWEAARNVVDCKVPFDFWELASGQSMLAVFKRYSAKEAIEKIREYEEKQKEADEIKVGDEVYLLDENYHGVVTAVWKHCGVVKTERLTQSGKLACDDAKDLHRTGRRFPEIANVLKQMQEEE